MEPPPAKRARRGGASAPAIASGGSRRTTRSQKPRLSAELLAKISTFSSLGDDLLNLCIVAGPKDCAIVRHEYLHKNCNYLWRILEAYAIHKEIDWRKCRDCYREWMAVNTQWRELVTDELIEDLAVVGLQNSEGKFSIMIHPYIPFNNPSVAIEIGLVEALQYLVEGKGIDVNQYRWNSYKSYGYATDPHHLLMECIIVENHEAFQFILERGDIDVSVRATKNPDSNSVFDIASRHSSRSEGPFFQSFIDSSNFDKESTISNDECSIPVLHWLIISTIVHSAEVWFDLRTWKDNFKYILNAGADPHRSSEAGNAIDYAKLMLIDHPEHHEALEHAIEIMEMWGKKK